MMIRMICKKCGGEYVWTEDSMYCGRCNHYLVGGTKHDQGKVLLMQGLIEYFPKACTEVAKCSEFGASKYSWGNWKNVEGCVDRYGNALMRHIVEEAKGELNDPESGLLHATHAAWNALAVLEQKLIAKEKDSGDS